MRSARISYFKKKRSSYRKLSDSDVITSSARDVTMEIRAGDVFTPIVTSSTYTSFYKDPTEPADVVPVFESSQVMEMSARN